MEFDHSPQLPNMADVPLRCAVCDFDKNSDLTICKCCEPAVSKMTREMATIRCGRTACRNLQMWPIFLLLDGDRIVTADEQEKFYIKGPLCLGRKVFHNDLCENCHRRNLESRRGEGTTVIRHRMRPSPTTAVLSEN